jgi:hypothetical protein
LLALASQFCYSTNIEAVLLIGHTARGHAWPKSIFDVAKIQHLDLAEKGCSYAEWLYNGGMTNGSLQ